MRVPSVPAMVPVSAPPLTATRIHRPAVCSCSSARPPSVPVRWSSTAVGVSAPPSTVRARSSRDAVSSRLTAACTASRAARCTTLLTATATVTNSTRASRLRGSPMVNVCRGGVRYQLSSRHAATAASTAGQKPPITVTVTTASRKTSRSSAKFRWSWAETSRTVSNGRPIRVRATPATRRRVLIAPVQAARRRHRPGPSSRSSRLAGRPSALMSTLSSVNRLASERNTVPARAHPAAVAASVIAASVASTPVGRRSAYGGREKPITVSQAMTPSGRSGQRLGEQRGHAGHDRRRDQHAGARQPSVQRRGQGAQQEQRSEGYRQRVRCRDPVTSLTSSHRDFIRPPPAAKIDDLDVALTPSHPVLTPR